MLPWGEAASIRSRIPLLNDRTLPVGPPYDSESSHDHLHMCLFLPQIHDLMIYAHKSVEIFINGFVSSTIDLTLGKHWISSTILMDILINNVCVLWLVCGKVELFQLQHEAMIGWESMGRNRLKTHVVL